MRHVTSDSPNKGRKLEGVQLLRGVAALGVVLTHAVTRSVLNQHDAFLDSLFRLRNGDQWKGGDIGVDIFFVISGFIIMVVHRGDLGKPKSYVDFLIKRFKRVVPLYWTFTTSAVALFLLAPQMAANSKSGINVIWIIFSYLFIPTSLSGINNSPVVGVGWTLDYEVLFYIIFALLMRFDQRLFVTLITVIFSALVLGGTVIQPVSLYGKFVSDWLLVDFIGGVWVAYIMLNVGKISTAMSITLIAISASAMISTFGFSVPEIGPMRLILWGLPSILLVQGVINLQLQNSIFRRVTLILGNASYSIYLSQVFTIPLWTNIVSKAKISPSIDIQIVIVFISTTISGVFVWFFLERNLNGIVNRLYRSYRQKALR